MVISSKELLQKDQESRIRMASSCVRGCLKQIYSNYTVLMMNKFLCDPMRYQRHIVALRMYIKDASKNHDSTTSKYERDLTCEEEAEPEESRSTCKNPHDPDQFGTLVGNFNKKLQQSSMNFEDDIGEEDDSEKPHIRLQEKKGKWTPYGYQRLIERLAKDGQIFEAVEVLEKRMLIEDRVCPNNSVFSALIGALGRVGYTHKAFKLFNQMKKFGLDPEDTIYTALFNACGNSPFIDDGLRRANKLRHQLQEKGYTPNVITYRAMIKAYGLCGDLQTAFELVDEMIKLNFRLDLPCFDQLLIACCSNKEAGLKMAIEVWRRMRLRKLTPTTREYNLLLRAVRDCGLGDDEFAAQLLDKTTRNKSSREIRMSPEIENTSKKQTDDDKEVLTVLPLADVKMSQDKDTANLPNCEQETAISHHSWWEDVTPSSETQKQRVLAAIDKDQPHTQGASVLDMVVPNLLNPRGKYVDVVALTGLNTPASRLALLGGLPGILSHMNRDGAKPDIKTFLFLSLIVPGEVENDLLAAMVANEVKMNTTFLNNLIQKRNRRKDYDGAKELVAMMGKLGLLPDLKTFGWSALGCVTWKDANQLLSEMEDSRLDPVVEVYDALLSRSGLDYYYKLKIIQHMEQTKTAPSHSVIERLEKGILTAKKYIVDVEHGKRKDISRALSNETFKRNFELFMKYYSGWIRRIVIDEPDHPWAPYRRPSRQTLEEMARKREVNQDKLGHT